MIGNSAVHAGYDNQDSETSKLYGDQGKFNRSGVVNEDTGELHLAFGSTAKTSDFIVDCLYVWWERQALNERDALSLLQIKVDNGPESNGRRTQFLKHMLEWAKSMSWKGIHPIVELTRQVYEKGVSLSKAAMQAVEARLERHPKLPKWDILIRPACMVCDSSEIT